MEKDSQIVFLIFKYPDDLDFARRVMGFMKYPAHLLLRRCTPSEMLDAVSAFDGLIGMRLHSLIFSSMAKIPSLGLSYDPKVESFQKSVGASSLEIGGLNESILISEFGKFADELKKVVPGVDQLTVKAGENITLLNNCLRNNRISVLGVEIDNFKFDDAVEKAEEIIASRTPGLIVTPNPEMIMASQNDLELKDIINKSQVSVADGVGLMIAGRMLRKKFKSRIAGIELMLKLVDAAKEKGYRMFLFGGAEGVAEKAAENLGGNVVGTFHGYSMNDHMIIEKIKAAKPDMLFIGLGSPKQEKWASKYLKELNVPLVMCVGGSMDVIAGYAKRAPLFMRNAGLEWLWRLFMEPRRWKRMLALPAFIIKVIRSRV
jgi:N-acetylglucosaminyldiphosphoundecaprenol N-acetyl-beta-D-mannosaminyltransferase